jgi:hypothetical protein
MLLKKKKGCESPSTSEVCFLRTKRADIVNLLKKPEKNTSRIFQTSNLRSGG